LESGGNTVLALLPPRVDPVLQYLRDRPTLSEGLQLNKTKLSRGIVLIVNSMLFKTYNFFKLGTYICFLFLSPGPLALKHGQVRS
jgi:hypothetical protein